ncbi:MAG: phosphatidate cytidylyltransferase [Planctomycetota bacterium]
MLVKRLLLGPVLVLVAAFVAWLDGALGAAAAESGSALLARWVPGSVYGLLGALGAAAGAVELARLQRLKGVPASPIVTAVAAVAGLASVAAAGRFAQPGDGAVLLTTAGVATLLVAVLHYGRDQRPDGMLEELSGVLLSFVFIGAQLGLYVAMRAEHSSWTVLWLVLTVKSCDIGAFVTGRGIGKNRLAAWISPGKTWEGFAGGVVMSSAVGGIGVWVLAQSGGGVELPIWVGAVIGGALGVTGQVGDLMVSLLKRDAGAKDAGSSLPGFGGVLDVLDSLLLAGPVGFWLLRLAVVQAAAIGSSGG